MHLKRNNRIDLAYISTHVHLLRLWRTDLWWHIFSSKLFWEAPTFNSWAKH